MFPADPPFLTSGSDVDGHEFPTVSARPGRLAD